MVGKGRRDLQQESVEALQAYKQRSVVEMRAFLHEQTERARDEEENNTNEWLAAMTAARKSNRSFVRSVESSLVAGLGWGLKEFQPARRVGGLPTGAKRYVAQMPQHDGTHAARSCISHPGGERYIEVPRKYVQGELCRPVLHIAADQGPGSMGAYLWMKTGLRLRCSLSFDLFHRVSNDWRSGNKTGSLNLLMLEFKTYTGMRHGPWKREGTHQLLQELAREYFALSGEGVADPLFHLMYDSILGDNPELASAPHAGSPEHIQEVWEWSKVQMLGAGIGERDDLSRWWAWEQQSRRVRPLRSLTLMLLCYLGMKRKWWRSAAEPLMGWMGSGGDTAEEPLPGEGCKDEEEKIDEEEDDEAHPDDAGDWQVDGARTVSKARTEVQKRRNTVQTLKYLTTLLADETRLRVWTGMIELPIPLERWFAGAIREVKSRKGVKELHLRLCRLELHGIAASVLRRFLSVEFASLIGMKAWSGSPRTQHLQRQDHTVAEALWEGACHACGRVALTSLSYSVPPVCLLKLLSEDASEVKGGLEDMERSWNALILMEETALVNKDAAAFVKNLTVPADTWYRELMVFCFEVGFQHVPEIVKRELEHYAETAFSSLLVECSFNVLRDKASKNRGGKMDPATAWHVLSHGGLLPAFDRPHMVPPPEAVSANDGQLPSGLHEGLAVAPSLPETVFDELTTRKPDWPTLSPDSYTQIPMAWHLLKHCGGEWSKMQLCWLSLLLEPGCLILDGETKKAYLVLHVCQYGFLCIRTPVQTSREVRIASDGESQIRWMMLGEPLTRWRVAELNVITPGVKDSSVGALALHLDAGGSSILRHAGRRGFRNLSLTFLRKLVQHLGLPVKGSLTGANVLTCVTLLLQHAFATDYTPELLEQASQARGLSGAKLEQHELFKSTRLFEMEREFVLDEHDVSNADLELQYEEMRTKHMNQTTVKTRVESVKPDATASGAASSSGTHEGQERKFLPVVMEGYSQQQAADWVPPGCHIYKDKKENRWRIISPHFAEGLSNTKSKSWGQRSGSDYDAMVWVIQKAWMSHQHATGNACPYTFEP
eukprot:6477055-Amphidinium_carterae.1